MGYRAFCPSKASAISQCCKGKALPPACSGSKRLATGGLPRPRGINAPVRTVKTNAAAMDEQDLLQFPDRAKWYEAKFAASDMPDWIPATFVESQLVSPGFKNVVIEHEISRERVPLCNAYKCAGQKASIRVNNGFEYNLSVASAPPSIDSNRDPLFTLKGDIFSEEVKVPKEPSSVKAQVHLLLSRDEAPEVWDLEEGDAVEVGPFRGTGLDLRSSVLCAIYRYRTVVLFVSGTGIATARALLESDATVQNLSLQFRDDVRMYYKAPNEMSFVYKEHWEHWEDLGCKVLSTTASFQDAFDDDQTLMYDPSNTAAIILTGGDEEEEAAVRELCKEAEITAILSDREEAAEPEYLESTPKTFARWANHSG